MLWDELFRHAHRKNKEKNKEKGKFMTRPIGDG